MTEKVRNLPPYRPINDVKSVSIWSFSGLYFPSFGLNMERHGVSLHIKYKWGELRTRQTPNTEPFHVVIGIKTISRRNKKKLNIAGTDTNKFQGHIVPWLCVLQQNLKKLQLELYLKFLVVPLKKHLQNFTANPWQTNNRSQIYY